MIQVVFQDGSRYEYFLVGPDVKEADIWVKEYNTEGALIQVKQSSTLRVAKAINDATGMMLNVGQNRKQWFRDGTMVRISENGLHAYRVSGPKAPYKFLV